MSNRIQELSNLIKNSKRIIILTGAGISTDSGLPDFRVIMVFGSQINQFISMIL